MVFNATFNNISVAVSFIGGGNQKNRRKPPTCRKSLTNFISDLRQVDGFLHVLQYWGKQGGGSVLMLYANWYLIHSM
jgi:hypothetical protein